jgi:hypothetical protein
VALGGIDLLAGFGHSSDFGSDFTPPKLDAPAAVRATRIRVAEINHRGSKPVFV